MNAVVDASVLVGALTDSGREGRWCKQALERAPAAAPELALAEATNILRRLELSRSISHLEATAAHRDLLRLAIELYPFAPFAGRVWELRENLTVYDAWYVALAEVLEWPLVTLDRRLTRADGPQCEMIVPPAEA
ncbi:MAG: type II toxin-antitoxin system VapC family toxin [Acidimicrobiaceae bacterium]|nr:type II toxin-antitoxin system VapC family toxin [Acidimicrobiaceae bacterium]MYF41710.1 type II toxin-antitoxin system VapC family toxin [Acidimicrobiaceae bacterium]MYJ35082.1 type II toxin-antitoxin system VapC family toxin [Acidimicrobiaceae bacterium]